MLDGEVAGHVEAACLHFVDRGTGQTRHLARVRRDDNRPRSFPAVLQPIRIRRQRVQRVGIEDERTFASFNQFLDKHGDVGTEAESRAQGNDVLLQVEHHLERARCDRPFSGFLERNRHVFGAHRGDDRLGAARCRNADKTRAGS